MSGAGCTLRFGRGEVSVCIAADDPTPRAPGPRVLVLEPGRGTGTVGEVVPDRGAGSVAGEDVPPWQENAVCLEFPTAASAQVLIDQLVALRDQLAAAEAPS